MYQNGIIGMGKDRKAFHAHAYTDGLACRVYGRGRVYSSEEGCQELEQVSAQFDSPHHVSQYLRSDFESHRCIAGEGQDAYQNFSEKATQGRARKIGKCGIDGYEAVRAVTSYIDSSFSDEESRSANLIGIHQAEKEAAVPQAIHDDGLQVTRCASIPKDKSAPQRLCARVSRHSRTRYSPNYRESGRGGGNVHPLFSSTTKRASIKTRLVSLGQVQSDKANRLVTTQTGNGGKNLTGLAAAIADTPTSGTYGGIDRATWSFWQNQFYRGVTDGGAAVSAANIQAYMTTLALRCVRGSDMPDLWIGSSNYYSFYVNSLQAIQRITSSDGDTKAGAGFPTLGFSGGGMNAKVVLGGGINGPVNTDGTTGGEPTSHFYAINTDYLFFRPHRDRNFVPIGGERQSVNQDAIVKLIGWAGNLTSCGPQFCGVLEA